jgi:hypothetical protein|tara:strand:+ start:1142 stop:1804 length:663 start_codon:yes stop_codon:yes gene_type:complete
MLVMADSKNPYRQKTKRLVSQGRTSKRLSGLTPDGLRKRVLDALPRWESYPRWFRRVLVLLPTHGDLYSIAEELGMQSDTLIEMIDKRPTFGKLVRFVNDNGHYPACATTKEYLKHANLVEHYANESTVSAVIHLETNAGQAPINHKIVESAGWFANIENDTERVRRQQQHSLDKYEQKIDSQEVIEEVEEGLQPFVRDINPEEKDGNEESKVSEETSPK